MKQSKWMWYPGDFELYMSFLLHNRREEGDKYKSPMWRIDMPHGTVRVYKIAELTHEEPFYATAKGPLEIIINNKSYSPDTDITLMPGRNFIKLTAYCEKGFPCFYCKGETFSSDETWQVASFSGGNGDPSVGTNDMYTEITDDPTVFKFSYKRIYPSACEKLKDGVLFDFGREVMGKLILSDTDKADGRKITVSYGESRDEAIDFSRDKSIIYEDVTLSEKETVLRTRACRYVYIIGDTGSLNVSYDYEYLPIEQCGLFDCDNDLYNQIFKTAAYTMELNTREGFFDGIKRDRWVWAGDAYQSTFVHFYLTHDRDTVRRTLRILRGAGELDMHINTIVDYTLYWLLILREYYFYTADSDFVSKIFPETESIRRLISSRLDENGFIVGYQRKGDWTFIDWSDSLDKDGAVAAEQMLLCAAYTALSECAGIADKNDIRAEYEEKAAKLKANIDKFFWDSEKGAYIDSFSSGKRNVSRHSNIFALLFGIADDAKKEMIIKNVILNDSVPKITTPYFEFFELDAMCSLGDTALFLDMLENYWGGMVRLGATTFWERFNPSESREQHFAMYGKPYGCSLCHAWSASPIYLFGKYILGVAPTSPGYKTYKVEPHVNGFKSFHGKVPVPGGFVCVDYKDGKISVESDIEGGTLVLDGKTAEIVKNSVCTM